MPIVNTTDLLVHARAHGYAVASFAPINLETLAGILDAAEQAEAPVMLAPEPHPDTGIGLDLLMPAVVSAARRSVAPVAIQIGGCTSEDLAARAIRLGANAVGTTVSDDPPPMQIEIARAVSTLARNCGVTVEGAVKTATPVEQVSDYTGQTDVEVLRVVADGIDGAADIDQDWIRAVARATNLPLALSPAPAPSEEMFGALIDNGVARVAFDDVPGTALSRVVGAAPAGTTEIDAPAFARDTRTATRDAVTRCLKVLRGNGRGENILRSCRAWREVEHLIVYNVNESMAADDVEAMMARGRAELSMIPGVRRVFTGRSVNEQAQYRYCWLVRFCDEAVIPFYRDHPDHVEFADTVFRPVAGERISIDFEAAD